MILIGSSDYSDTGYETIYDMIACDYIVVDQTIISTKPVKVNDLSKLPMEIKTLIIKYVFDQWLNAALIHKAYQLSTLNKEIFYYIYNSYRGNNPRTFFDKYEWRNMIQLLKKIDLYVNQNIDTSINECFYGFEITHIRSVSAFKHQNITPYSTFLGMTVVEYMTVHDNYILVKTGPSMLEHALIQGKTEYGHINETKLMLPCVVLRIVDTRGRNHFSVPHKFHGSWRTFSKMFKQCYGKYAQLLIEVQVKRGDIYTSSLVPL